MLLPAAIVEGTALPSNLDGAKLPDRRPLGNEYASHAVLISSFVGNHDGSLNDRGFTKKIVRALRRCIREYGPDDKIGFASTTAGLNPINGLRNPPTPGMSGWFIWCGEAFSEAADFFDPQCARHFYENVPNVGRLLGLPPGYRFLLAGDYPDVWYDEKIFDL